MAEQVDGDQRRYHDPGEDEVCCYDAPRWRESAMTAGIVVRSSRTATASAVSSARSEP